MIEHQQIEERIMRMGIEHRAGVELDDLWDLAIVQLKKEQATNKVREQQLVKYKTLIEWFNDRNEYAFNYFNSADKGIQLRLIRVTDVNLVNFVEWRSGKPVVTIRNAA